MAILTERKVWRKPREKRATQLLNRLTPEEQANVRAAANVLRIRLGTWAAVAEAMGATSKSIEKMTATSGHPSAGLALRVARAAGVPMEDVLTGAFPKPGSCPMCGRCG